MVEVLIVASPGGHLKVAEELFDNCEFKTKIITTRSHSKQITTYETVTEFNRNWKLLLTMFDAWQILKRTNPKIIVSTGAGVAIPFFILGLMTNKTLVFVESISRINTLSLTGKLSYYFVDKIYVRNIELAKKYKKAVYVK